MGESETRKKDRRNEKEKEKRRRGGGRREGRIGCRRKKQGEGKERREKG